MGRGRGGFASVQPVAAGSHVVRMAVKGAFPISSRRGNHSQNAFARLELHDRDLWLGFIHRGKCTWAIQIINSTFDRIYAFYHGQLDILFMVFARSTVGLFTSFFLPWTLERLGTASESQSHLPRCTVIHHYINSHSFITFFLRDLKPPRFVV